MTEFRSASLTAAVVVAASLAGASALADTPPARIGNVWHGLAHEPVPASVTSQEQAAGISLPAQRDKAETEEVETLCERLLRDEGLATAPARTLAPALPYFQPAINPLSRRPVGRPL